MAMRIVVVFLCVVIGLTSQLDDSFSIENVQVENEDGTTQVFEVKQLEPARGETCLLCSLVPVNSVPSFTPLQSNVFISVGEVTAECDNPGNTLPIGLCSSTKDIGQCSKEAKCNPDPEDLADRIVEEDALPFKAGEEGIDRLLALGVVQMNMGDIDAGIKTLVTVIGNNPNVMAAYYYIGVGNTRKGLKAKKRNTYDSQSALRDFSEAEQREPKAYQIYARRAELYLQMKKYDDAMAQLKKAAELNPDSKVFYMKGIFNLMMENFAEAEEDFKRNLDKKDYLYLSSYYHLGIAQYYRGKIRNAIEVFKEIVKTNPEFLDASTSLGQAFKELGNLRAARTRFNHSLSLNPHHIPTFQMRGRMLYDAGETSSALQDFTSCLEHSPSNIKCQYMQSLSYAANGNFYESVKATTKVLVNSNESMKASPEFVKAHYLREYARYLHNHLDKPLLDPSWNIGLTEEFKDHWAKLLPFHFRHAYKEQPGLQPDIKDIENVMFARLSESEKTLLCKAEKIGWSTQVNTDGYTPNRRLNLAMGLAAIHIAQILEARWKGLRANKQMDRTLGWREIFDIAVQYRRLVDPEYPVLWLESMPDHGKIDGYRSDINFVKGSVVNIKVQPYFDLVFKLGKTMLQHYTENGAVMYPGLSDDIERAKTCEDLLDIARKRQINQHGFMVSTQVPSSRKGKENLRLDGSLLVLTEDITGKIVFSMNVLNTHARTMDFNAELDYVFNLLHEEIKRTGVSKVTDIDSVLNIILTLVYYFYNLMPLTRGSSVVAYSVALGVIMSIGRQVTGRIPSGKLLEMEAMLSGAPDAFILVSKQWMNIKRLSIPTLMMPKVWEALPTVRSVLEVLNMDLQDCPL